MRRSLLVLAMTPLLMATQCRPWFELQTRPGPEPMQAIAGLLAFQTVLNRAGL